MKSRESGTNRILEIKQRKFYATAEKSAKSPQPQWKVCNVKIVLKFKKVVPGMQFRDYRFKDIGSNHYDS